MSKHRTKSPYIHLSDAPSKGPSLISIFICFCISRFLGSIMVFFRLRGELKRKRHSDYSTYANIIGNRITVSISELADKCGKTPVSVMSDLQSMIDKGIIAKGAYIDRKKRLLILDPTILEAYFTDADSSQADSERFETVYTTFTEPRKKEEPAEERDAAAENSQPIYNFSGNEEYEEKLRQIRQLDMDIADEAVSRRIDRIGHLTASIFRVVQEHPDRTEEVRRFMNYYLPTTFKLLKSYSLMEKQTYQGDNIAASRKKIEDILDTLVHAFEQQLDRLFHAEALDVDADISVLETMMTSDGLIEPEISLRSAASQKRSK